MLLISEYATSFVIPIIILLALTVIPSILITVLKIRFLPIIVGQIIVGLIIARWFNTYIIDGGYESFIAGINIISLVMLMFISGYDVDFDVFKDLVVYYDLVEPKKINVFKKSLLMVGLIYLSSAIAATAINYFFGNKQFWGFILLTIVFASTFAGMVVPILHEERSNNSVLGKIISTIANLSEAITIIALTILMIILDTNRNYIIIFILLVVLLVLYLLIRHVKVGKVFEKIPEGIDHLITRVIIIALLSIVFLSDCAGGEYILGAFFFGIFVRNTGFSKKVNSSLSRIVFGVFAPLFFVLVGTQIDILSFFQEDSNIWLLIVLFFTFLVVELPVLFLLKWYRINAVISVIFIVSCTIIAQIAARHIGLEYNLFNESFADALVLSGLLVSIIGGIIYRIQSPFRGYHNLEDKDDYE